MAKRDQIQIAVHFMSATQIITIYMTAFLFKGNAVFCCGNKGFWAKGLSRTQVLFNDIV